MRRIIRRKGWELLLGILCAAWFAGVVAYKAHAHDWYPKGCCNGSDCHRARAYIDPNSGWWMFQVAETKAWMTVHPSQIITSPAPPDSMCHVCYRLNESDKSIVYVYCFFPCGAKS